MGIYDRDYTRPTSNQSGYGYRSCSSRPPITPVVKWLLIINVVVFVVETILDSRGRFFAPYFAVIPQYWWQIWRLISYQFLHAHLMHVFFNMLILFFFGPMFEMLWGAKKFLRFYLICGAVGGLVYPLLAAAGWLDGSSPMVGASGSLYGLLAATAILYPNAIVRVYGIIPVKMSILAVILVVMSMLFIWQGNNAGGEAAHLSGMAAGAIMVLAQPWLSKKKMKNQQGTWQKKLEYERNFQREVDRILNKVHTSGITSLTRKEKKILKHATEMEQDQ